jgi:iron complex outermembrane receptor protein
VLRPVFGALVIAAFSVSALPAQERPIPRDSAYRLPGISVTAMRSPLHVLSTPLAVSVVTRTDLQNTNGLQLDQGFFTVPGVLAQSRYGSSDIRIVIRGFGARGAGDRSNAGTSRGIRILQDGMPETEPDGRTALDLIDLAAMQRIEVVRSNASAVWGNAAGGLIGFSSVPTFDQPFLGYEQQMGGFGLQREILQTGAMVGSNSRLFASVVRTDFDGWRANSGSKRTLVSTGLLAPLGDRTELELHVVAADNEFGIPGPLTQAALEADPEQANATYLARRERRHNRVGRVGIEMEHEMGSGQMLSGMFFVNPKYLQRSERGTFRDFTRYHIGGNFMFRDERAFSPSVNSSFTLGTDEAYQDGAILFYSLAPDGERGSTLTADKREGANNFGIFAQEQLKLGQNVELTLGARYDNITYYANDFLNSKLDDRKSFTRVSPKLGLVYRFSAEHSFYANLGGGVEAPAGNETDPASTFGQDTVTALNPLLEPIRSSTYEMGTKHVSTLSESGFLRRLVYDVALYWTDVRNEIVPYRGGRFYFTAGQARRKGAELGLQLETAPGLSLATALTFSNNRYREYVVDSVHYGKPGAKADFSGNKVVGVPDFFASAALHYAPAFLNAFEFGLDVQNVKEFFADDANRVRVPGYTLYNGSVALRRPVRLGNGLTARAFLRLDNLTDESYVASAFLNPDVVNGVPVVFEPGLPRHATFSVSFGWGR